MDEHLGPFTNFYTRTEKEKEAPVTDKMKDGTLRLTCPVGGCTVQTFKLSRHIDTQHPQLDAFSKQYAKNIAKVMAVNCFHIGKTADDTDSSKMTKKRSFRNTALVAKKSNYKRCIECDKLILNLSDHLIKTHKFNKSSDEYRHIMANSKLVLKIHTKCVDGKIIELEGEELVASQDMHSDQLKPQSETLVCLKEIRASMLEVNKQIANETDNAIIGNLKDTLNKLKSQYKEKRYLDTTDYSKNLVKWRESYLRFLQSQNELEPKRNVTVASSIINDYEKHSNTKIDFEHLIDGVYVSKMIKHFTLTTNTNSTTKIKYLRIFQKLFNFLTTNVNSPERRELSHEEIVKKQEALKEVEAEIDAAVTKLSKNRGLYIIY